MAQTKTNYKNVTHFLLLQKSLNDPGFSKVKFSFHVNQSSCTSFSQYFGMQNLLTLEKFNFL